MLRTLLCYWKWDVYFLLQGPQGVAGAMGFNGPKGVEVCVIFLYDTLITSMLHVWLSVRLICLGHFYFYFSFCFSLVFFLLGAFLIKQLFHFCQLGATSLISYLLTSKEAQVIYYTVIKHNGHLRTWGKCRKQEPQTSLFCISRVFSRSYLYNNISYSARVCRVIVNNKCQECLSYHCKSYCKWLISSCVSLQAMYILNCKWSLHISSVNNAH